MATIAEKIGLALQRGDRLCDDCISEVTGVSPRQSINLICRKLHAAKHIGRAHDHCAQCGVSKIVNWLENPFSSKPTSAVASTSSVPSAVTRSAERPWYWEGNVQQRIVEFLVANGYVVRSAADTASKQHGKDIVALAADGRPLWVTVKGFPDKSKNPQARHWLEGALHDLTRYRDEDAHAVLAMGLPHGFKTYEGLLKRHVAVRRFLNYSVYWVCGDGSVFVERAT